MIKWENNITAIWSEKCIILSNRAATLRVFNTKLGVPLFSHKTTNNAIFLQQVKSGIERSVNWNKWKVKQNNEINNAGCFNVMVGPSVSEKE